jgi:hypothetical protein
MKLNFDTIEFWNNLNHVDKRKLIVQMFALFPKVLSGHSDKYNKPSLWLIKYKMIINHNLRDSFTAGRNKTKFINGEDFKIPSILVRLEEYFDDIKIYLQNDKNYLEIKREWDAPNLENDKIFQSWIKLARREIKHNLGDTFPVDIYLGNLNK